VKKYFSIISSLTLFRERIHCCKIYLVNVDEIIFTIKHFTGTNCVSHQKEHEPSYSLKTLENNFINSAITVAQVIKKKKKKII